MRKGVFKKRHGSRGMTLVELLVVMVILSVVMMAVMSLYVPIQQSTVTQTQVTDVQSNLRLALRTMTRDLLIAGLMMPYDPIAFPLAAPSYYVDDPTSPGAVDHAEFIIRTRAVGNSFARVTSGIPITDGLRLTVADPTMLEAFAGDSRVRLFEPVTGREVNDDKGDDIKRAYRVITKNPGAGTIDIDTSAIVLTVPELTAMVADLEAKVLLRVRDVNQPALQTIRYRLSGGALERYVNGDRQILARNVDTSNPTPGGPSFFDYTTNPEGRVNRVDIKLTGRTRALKDDAISGEKSRAIVTTVKLRNVN